MKLDEVASSKVRCGLIMPAGGEESVDRSDWHGSTEVYTNQGAFLKAVKGHLVEYLKMFDEPEKEVLDMIKNAKTMENLSEVSEWENFIESIWIDDRF